MADEKEFEPFILLSTRVSIAATTMLEEIGYLTGVRHTSETGSHRPHQMADLRAAIAKAAAAVDSWDVVTGAGLERLTGTAFDDAAKHIADEWAVA